MPVRRPARGRPPLSRTPADGAGNLARLVPRSADQKPLRIGTKETRRFDFYHHTLTLPWWSYLALGVAAYLALNVIFAELYLLQPSSIDHARPGVFADAFFFSIQTMATIGYGVLTPVGTYANLLVTAETMVSLVFITFITGITFARFSRPTAQVMFSQVVTVSTYNGAPTLSVRLANARRNQILEADVALTLVRNETTSEGIRMRRFYDLELARRHTPIFSLSFMAMHAIDAASPLYGATAASLAAEQAELLVTVMGIDETMSQTIHARTSYWADEFVFGRRFADLFGYTPEGRMAIDYARFHETLPDGVARPSGEAA